MTNTPMAKQMPVVNVSFPYRSELVEREFVSVENSCYQK